MRRKTLILRSVLVIVSLLLILNVPSALGHDYGRGGYDYDQMILKNNPEWMASFPDSMRISELSIPGTHDTMARCKDKGTCGHEIGFLWVKTQSFSLDKQLQIGIRALDIRTKECKEFDSDSDYFAIVHGDYWLDKMVFDTDVLEPVKNFLADNPTETILMRIKREDDCLMLPPTKPLKPFEQVLEDYVEETGAPVWFPPEGVEEPNPTLGEVRGKIVILVDNFAVGNENEYGLKWPQVAGDNWSSCVDGNTYIHIQDCFEIRTWGDHMVEKWNKIKYLLDEADTGSMDDIYINFLSGVGDGPDADGRHVVTPFPFFVASGHIVEGARFEQGTDGGHQQLRGRDVPDECGPFYLPKGVKQFEDRCVFTGMNELILDKWINDDAVTKQTGRIGIIMADFPSDLLVDAIIAVNNLPPIADVNGPYVGNEGSEIIFDASASSDPDGDALQYRWDFNDDGIWDTGWSPDPTAGYTWYDDWQGTVKVEVSDGKYTVGAAAAVTVNNVDPVVSIDSITDATTDLPIGPDLPLPVALVGLKVNLTGSFSDPGTADTHTATVDWGDDTDVDFLGNVVNVANASHVYFEPGDYTITLEVTDDDGGVGTATAQIKVVDAADAIEIVVDLLLPYDGDSNVTDAIDKLRGEDGGEADNGALDMMAKGNLNAAMEKILQAEQALETVDLPYIKSLLALAAKSGALEVVGQAEAAASKQNELRKIEEAKALMEQADACLADHDFVGAVDMCQAACRELQGIQ